MPSLPNLLLLVIVAAAPAAAAQTPPATPAPPTTPPAATAPPAAPKEPAPARAALAAEFARIDTNDDGRTSSSEYEVYTRLLFDQMDTDADYKLTVAEIMVAPRKFFRHVSAGAGGLFGGTELTSAEKIQRIDANHDGVVSRDEHANAATAKFQRMDINNNGELTAEEFAAGG